MKRSWLLMCALASGCASAELRSNESDPANPSATVAALDPGIGALSSSFSPEQIAPASEPSDDPHAGHEHHAAHEPAAPSESATADPHAGHEMPTASASASAPRKPIAAPKKPAAPTAATTYTCMHHPEIVSTTKGQCPKCGMDLVPKKPAASSGGKP